MKINKTWRIAGAALLTIVAFVLSIKLGFALVGLFVLVRLIQGPSASGGIIGIDHINRPRGSKLVNSRHVIGFNSQDSR